MSVTHLLKLSDIVGDVPLKAAEERLIETCGTGEVAWFGNERPTTGTDENTLRATLIRHILLGGCADVPVHVKGVRVEGAWITGVLDLEACESSLDLYLGGCTICEPPVLLDALLGSVMLPGCAVPGLSGHRMRVVRGVLLNQGFKSTGTVDLSRADIGVGLVCDSGSFEGTNGIALNCNGMTAGEDVFLHNGFAATGQVNLRAARITGQLACSGGTFDGADGVALNCDGMMVGASVVLRDGFVATGQVSLRGARITGQLACDGGRFDGADGVALMCDTLKVGASVYLSGGFSATGRVNLTMAQIMGSLRCSKATFRGVLTCEGMTVGGGMYWQDVTKPPQAIDLTDVYIGVLRDDGASWQGCRPVLNGFRYDRIISGTSVTERLVWLETGENKKIERGGKGRLFVPKPVPDVDAQPYTQFAGVLDGQGHRRDAAAVRFEREKRVRKTQNVKWLVEASLPQAGMLQKPLARLRQSVDWVFGAVFGYGHRPMRALLWVLGIWAVCFALYGAAYDAGQMAPNSDVILTSEEWLVAAEDGCSKLKQVDCEMPLTHWLATDTATDYETFNRGLYALDLFVPLDALGQENAWAPSKDRGDLGLVAYYLRVLVQMSGWVITAVGAAALTGVIGRKE